MAKATALAAAVLMLAGAKPLAGGRSGHSGFDASAGTNTCGDGLFVLTIAPYMVH
jgi:hypothetical protein